MVSLSFFRGLDEEALVEAMEEEEEEEEEEYEEDDEENEKDDHYLIKRLWIILPAPVLVSHLVLTIVDFGLGYYEKYLRHSHHYHRLCNERMMRDQRRRRKKQKWNDDLFSCHNPFMFFAHVKEREDT
nr:hypothetical protein [Tanacetum cinerariifolium]